MNEKILNQFENEFIDEEEIKEADEAVNYLLEFKVTDAILTDTNKFVISNLTKYPLLSAGEELELAKRFSEGDQDAKEKLILSNSRLVMYIAKKYVDLGLDYIDLVSEGLKGLSTAVEKFDYTKGFRFSTYAYHWVRQAITKAITNDGSSLRLPSHIMEKRVKIRSISNLLIQKLGRCPTYFEIANASNGKFSEEEVERLLNINTSVLSLDKPLGPGEDDTFYAVIKDKNCEPIDIPLARDETASIVETMLNTLTEKEKRVLQLRFGFGDYATHTLEEIAEEFGVTRERIRQIESGALARCKQYAYAHNLASIL